MAVHKNARRGSEFADAAMGLGVEELVERYGTEWLASARRAAATPADAEDAYQRAVEKLITTPPAEEDPERIAAWMHVVVKNEALQLRRAQRQLVDGEFEAIADQIASDRALPEDQALDNESKGWAREALRRLRPDQLRCLLLRADGFGYPAICELTGFSYAKVNRLLSEGRKVARMRDEAIAAGHECERLEPVISRFVDGVLDGQAEADLLLHFDHCGHCKAVARDYAATPRDLAELFPVGVLAIGGSVGQRISEQLRQLVEMFHARLGSGNPEIGLPAAKKVAALVAVAGTVVAGGLVVNRSIDTPDPREPRAARQPQPTVNRSADRTERRQGRAAQRSRVSRTPESSVHRIVQDPETPVATRQLDVPGAANTGIAADPADRPSAQTPPDQSGALAP